MGPHGGHGRPSRPMTPVPRGRRWRSPLRREGGYRLCRGNQARPGREQPNPGRPAFAGERGEATAGPPAVAGRGAPHGGRAGPGPWGAPPVLRSLDMPLQGLLAVLRRHDRYPL